MKILFDHQVFTFQSYGGISRYFCELSKELKTSFNQEVNILAPLYRNHYLKKYSGLLPVNGIYYTPIPKTNFIIRQLNHLFSSYKINKYQADIVHETYYSPKRIAPKNAKVVLTVYDMIHEKFVDQFSVKDRTQLFKSLAVNRADHIICISKQTQTDLIDILNVDPNKTSVVHLGFSLTDSSVSSGSISTQRPFLLYVGERKGYKNFENLIKAYAASKPLRSDFDVVCFGGKGASTDEKHLISQCGLSLERIHFVQGDDGLLAEYYQSASAFIYPSLYEGFGIPPLEAMSFNCPVVCSNTSSIPEVVGDAAEIFDPYDIDSICSAIERVVFDESHKQTLIQRGQQRIQLFSWRRCAEETLAVYQRLLS